MACKDCTGNKLSEFFAVQSDDNEYYLERNKSAWSILQSDTTGADVVNLFTRPSFELTGDAAFWTGGAIVTTRRFEGARSYEFATFAQYNLVPMFVGFNPYVNSYCITAMIRTCCGAKIKVKLGDKWESQEYTGNGCFQQVTLCTTPQAAGLIPDLLRFEVTGCSTNSQLDLVTVVQGTTAYTPFSGDSEGASWNGLSHASASTFAASNNFGLNRINFLEDLGFKIIAVSGHGMPPLNLPSTPYARRSGARTQRSTALARPLVLTGELCACDWASFRQARLALIDALGINVDGSCDSNKKVTLEFACVDECGEYATGEPVKIDVSYVGGLEGQETRPFCERMSLAFTAFDDPLFRKDREFCNILTPGVAVTVNNPGNASTTVKLIARNRGSVLLRSITNNTTGVGVVFDSGGGNIPVPFNQDLIFKNEIGGTSLFLSNGTNLASSLVVSSSSSPTKFLLQKGNNSITLDATITGANTQVTICRSTKFLSSDSACESCS